MSDAVFNGRVIARSERTVVVESNHHFPPADVDSQFLRQSRLKSLCLWNGIANYYTVDVVGGRGRQAAWAYRHPSPLAGPIRDPIAFAGDVQVRVTG